MLEGVKNSPEKWWHSAGVYEDVEVLGDAKANQLHICK